jgi:uncharacterized protein
MLRLLIVTSGIFHPPLLGRRALVAALSKMGNCQITAVPSLESLPDNLDDFSAILLYLHHKTISSTALSALDLFVSRGGGLVGVHSASASFKLHPHYFEILGGRFTRHGPVTEFEVRQTRTTIFPPILPFTIRDELYLHDLQPGVEIHFTARLTGEEVPVVWTHRYGQGRVCYASPGHTTAAMRHPTMHSILQQALGWVCQ